MVMTGFSDQSSKASVTRVIPKENPETTTDSQKSFSRGPLPRTR